jgi:hypothetical protein
VREARGYDPAMSPTLLALGLLIGLLTLIPARRLFVAGWSSGTIAGYYLVLCLLAMLVLTVPGRTRFLVPVILIGWVLPFVTFRAGLDRLLGRRNSPPNPSAGVRPPARNVTPPETREHEPRP